MSDADFIVVGSGPAGVSASVPLVDAGRKVLMLDGGRPGEAVPQGPARMLGPELEGLSLEDGLSPKLRAPEARLALAGFQRAHGVKTDNFLAVGSLARGGLSRVWGAFAAEFDRGDLEGWPLALDALTDSYRRVTARIGISGTSDDAAGRWLGASGPLQPPLPLGAGARRLLARYRGGELALGLARNALLSRATGERSACDLRGGCLWGCPIGAIYDARQDIAQLTGRQNFRIVDSAEVVRLERKADGWHLHTAAGRSFAAPRVLLAAGTLGSTRLVAPLLPGTVGDWQLLSNPVLANPLLLPSALAARAEAGHDLAQLSYFLRFQPGAAGYASGAIYETARLPVSSFASQLPLGRRAGEAVFRFLSPGLLVAVTYFSGAFSRNRLRFDPANGTLAVTGGFADGFGDQARAVSHRLARHWRALGAWPLPGGKLAMPGTDAHFAGTLPMGGSGPHGTSPSGEVREQSGLHVVDGSVLPTLPSRHATLTIMANADRIGRILGTSG